jgi:hypothetical protein
MTPAPRPRTAEEVVRFARLGRPIVLERSDTDEYTSSEDYASQCVSRTDLVDARRGRGRSVLTHNRDEQPKCA